MLKANQVRDQFVKEFTETFMEKLFYFCLKKTGNNADAEDLTQDIALHIITALNNDTVPKNFSAWVWQIARNRYAKWTGNRRRQRESVTGHNIEDYEIEDENGRILDEMINAEQMGLLRRELAFIKRDYRDIIVAYYIENKGVREIAASVSLSVSAVQQRLHRARIILKEGMEMAREFGKLSYKPEDITFIKNGMPGENGEPWNYLTRALCKNILLAAYRTPSTAVELAVELGVALPYMEEELTNLVDATLMKKKDQKYETNFFIVSKEAQRKIFNNLRDIAPELTKAMIDTITFQFACWDETCPDWHEGYQSFEDAKWALLMMCVDRITDAVLKPYNKNAWEVPNIGPWGHTMRPNEGEWDVLGMEAYNGDRPGFVGLAGCYASPKDKDLPSIAFQQYCFDEKITNKLQANPLTYIDGQALVSVAKGNSADVDGAVLQRLVNYGYIQKTDNGYIPTILVFRGDKQRSIPKKSKPHYDGLRRKVLDIATAHYLFCREQIYQEIPEFLREDTYQVDHACANIFTMRGAVLEEAIKQGYLSNKNTENRILGAYLVI